MEALRYKPVALWRLDDTSPFIDYSGYSRPATATGTETTGIPLTADSVYSQLFNTTHVGTFEAPVYLKNFESNSFSIAATFFTAHKTGSIQILGKSGQMDGLFVEDNKICFSTKYTSTGEAKCSYEVETNSKIDAVGVHTYAKNSLYINGELVDEVDISEQQQLDSYASSSTSLSSGTSSTGNSIFANNFVVFLQPLQPEAVKALWAANNRSPQGSIAKQFGGEDVPVGPSARTPYLDTGWYSEDDWEDASLFDVVVDDGQLHASMKDGLTLSGAWIGSVDLYKGPAAPVINSVNIWWEGKNETVEASVDGTTWAAVTKGVNLSIIPSGFNATDKALYIRITFSTGVGEAYVDHMRVRGYIGNTATSANRTITYNNATVLLAENHPALLREDTGVQINSGGSVVIGPELSSAPTPTRTIELWVKPSATTTATLGTTSSATYKNGVAGTETLNANEWVVYHRVLSANLTGSLTIDVPGQVAKVALYDTALSAAEISAIVDNYTGTDKSRYDGTGLISITESATSTTIYAHDWEILTA